MEGLEEKEERRRKSELRQERGLSETCKGMRALCSLRCGERAETLDLWATC